MAEETWNQARLIPTSGIKGADEQERRATSALLAVMSSVREFGRRLTQPMGAPAGPVEAYIEVPFALGERRLYPDGLIRVRRGQKTWTALVEVKTGEATLDIDQIENYVEIARQNGYDAVLTISNEIPAAAGQHPTAIDGRKLRKVDLHHRSWSAVLTEAVLQKEYRGVADPDQAWILGELIRYLEHPKSGALEFRDMGPSWVALRDAVAAGTLRVNDKSAVEVTTRFDALLSFASLQLGRKLGEEVVPALTRKERDDPPTRTASLVQALAEAGTLSGAIRIPHAVGPLVVTADLRARRITCHVDVEAPREGRPTTRVNWLLRQLRDAPSDVRLESFVMHGRGLGAAELLGTVRETPSLLVVTGKDLKSFRIASSAALGNKGGRGRGCFIDSVIDTVGSFYGDVIQQVKAWSPAPPRLRELQSSAVEDVRTSSTALSSQDGTDTQRDAPASADGTPASGTVLVETLSSPGC